MTEEESVKPYGEGSKVYGNSADTIGGANQSSRSKFRTFTRLVVGGLALGMDGLSNRMSDWDAVATGKTSDHQPSQVEKESNEFTSQPPSLQSEPSRGETTSQLTRYALIGLVFTTEESLRSRFAVFGRLGSRLGKAAEPIAKPINQSPALSSARKRYNKLVNRGQLQVAEWIDIGREEEIRSRQLVQVALNETVDTSIEYLAENTEIQELIQSQGTGLANEVVEEIRERTVSADTLFENVLRSILRLKPRSEMSGPPLEVRLRALSLHPEVPNLDERTHDDELPNG
jgi:hypothetical protein